ncbi:MAG: PhnA domain-containing protein [Gammaproteobacteria bacterium]
MSIESDLHSRSKSICELCGATDSPGIYEVPPVASPSIDACILICGTCKQQIEDPSVTDPNHWRCLNDSMWSQTLAVQVVAWRMLTRLSAESWPQDLLDMLYLDESALAWAKATNEDQNNETDVKHLDSNGALLSTGDTVTLTKDLTVKGASFTAKRGTAVRKISLVPGNSEQIEGRIDGQQIVILTKFVKKSG